MATEDASLEEFRRELVSWIEEKCPSSLRRPADGSARQEATPQELEQWREATVERGYTTPTWPSEYGGGGLSSAEARVLAEEFMRVGCYAPPVSFFGVSMLGPVLFEFGSEAQKHEHLPKITSGEVMWCQGYSEPGAGSDLAGLQTRAEPKGDQYIINGSKIWTTQANIADWIFCLVRTDPTAPKHDGISFILFDLHQPGVTISPIELISGQSDFCQVFFEDVRADARNLVGKAGGGWTIAKRLLQHERQTLSGGMGGAAGPIPAIQGKRKKAKPAAPKSLLAEGARPYLGDPSGQLPDPALRDRIVQWELDSLCFGLSLKRSGEAAKAGQGGGAASSMFKLYASELNKRRCELQMSIAGSSALGWSGEGFSDTELSDTRAWLRSKGNSIEGGTSEVQLNVVAKRVLGLPD